ncbi:hypothetical protein DUNSADRAFT_14722 [Dunaliella salina]|uniref:DUF1499 domain-containing protein n=1 Tax=Dunaliella salina TaxID=3046 RepID=A0ABQ7H2G4_DUNSA|nr:hypothetical protein DUNSADRAFT_14722 [Dunaliella salina]|eukprot:KAF5841015.1 hypothetical protein DUNSADRAFT_14722 [Dunaliella salina]
MKLGRRGLVLAVAAGVLGIGWIKNREQMASGFSAPIINDVATRQGYDLLFPLSPSIGPVPEGFRPIIEKTWGDKLAPFKFPASFLIDAAFDASLHTASKMGWDVKHVDRTSFVIQALDTTFWLRFKDDIVIKLSQQDGAVMLNMRSRSRVGKGDLGKNAARIQEYFKQLGETVGLDKK